MTAGSTEQVGGARIQPPGALRDAFPGGVFLISTQPPTPDQRWIARLLGVVLLGAFLVAFAFRHVQLARQDAFIPTTNAIVFVNDLITALLLFAQFSVTRSRALLVLASGYLLTAFIHVAHALSFPGAFAPLGLLGSDLQTTAWLHLSQFAAFLLGAVGYTVLRDRPDRTTSSDSGIVLPIGASVAGVAAAALALTWGLTIASPHLPPLMADVVHMSAGYRRLGSPMLALFALASIVVFRRRATSMVDLWVQLATWSWLLDVLLTASIQARFTLVFYAHRSMAVVSSGFVLIALLFESLMLHRRLVLAMAAREQEREGHRTAVDIIVGSLAHELRQPLASILVNESVGKTLLAAEPPERDEVRAVFGDIRASVLRANEVIDSVRNMFTPSARDQNPIDVNELARQAVELMHVELEADRVVVDLDLSPGLPPIQGHRGQLLEVLLNGLKNAVDSLAGVTDRSRQLCVRTGAREPDGVSISVEDSGIGLDAQLRDRIFEPFQTTKPGGTGLGLSICQSIVTAHGGSLSLTPRVPHGAVFRVELPPSPEAEASGRDPVKASRASVSPTSRTPLGSTV
jgi:signal transduction histidine kinase